MSQQDQHTKTIGEHEYEMYMLAPMKSHRLLVKVVQMIGPSLGPVVDMFYSKVSAGDISVLDAEVTPEFFTKAAGALFGDLNEKILDQVMTAFKEVTVVQGKGKLSQIFDAHFLGHIDEMYQWLAWGMAVQWGKVWSGLAATAAQKIAEAEARKKEREVQKGSQSPTI